LIEFGGSVLKADIVAADVEDPANIAIKVREKGWNPYRVRFDSAQSTWIVSSLDKFHRL
jgi:hypothetical protein